MWIEVLENNPHHLLSSFLHQATNSPAAPQTKRNQLLFSNPESWCDHPKRELLAAVAGCRLLRLGQHCCPSRSMGCALVSCEQPCPFGNRLKHLAGRVAEQSNLGLWYSYGINIHIVEEKVCAGGYLVSKSYTEDRREQLLLNYLQFSR